MEDKNLTRPNIPGWGADLGYEHRPGVPMEIEDRTKLPFNAPMVRARTGASTAPWHALSGKLRKKAYGLPEHFASRPLLLLLADRVDVLEHRLKRGWPVLAGVGLAGLVGLLVARKVKRRGKKLRSRGNALEFSGAPITGGEELTASTISVSEEPPVTCR